MDRRSSARPAWAGLPAGFRAAVEGVLGAGVVTATSCAGGWSPGTADRVELADGRRAFVKAASAEVNAHTMRLHRREAEVLQALDGTGAAPQLLGTAEDGAWFGLVEEDLGGREPDPHASEEVTAVLDAIARLPRADGAVRPLLRTASEDLESDARGWRRLIEDDALDAVPIGRTAAEALHRLAGEHPAALAGDRVVHLDLRLDNALIDADGRARLLDWPGAAIGAGWIDALTIVLDVRRLAGSAAAEQHLAHPVFADALPEHLDVLLAVLGAYFFDAARRPPSPGVEAVRAFQRRQGAAVLACLQERRPGLASAAPGAV